eukprot:UN34305
MDVYRISRCPALRCESGFTPIDTDDSGCADECKKIESCVIDFDRTVYESSCNDRLDAGSVCSVKCSAELVGGSILLVCPHDNIDPNGKPKGEIPPCFVGLGCYQDKGNNDWWTSNNPRAVAGGIGKVETIED